MGQLKIKSFEKIHRWTFEIIQKFGRKMKNFEIFFDVYMDTSEISRGWACALHGKNVAKK